MGEGGGCHGGEKKWECVLYARTVENKLAEIARKLKTSEPRTGCPGLTRFQPLAISANSGSLSSGRAGPQRPVSQNFSPMPQHWALSRDPSFSI